MAKSIPAIVKPDVLRWARESVNYTPLAASRKLQVTPERVEEWEQGTTVPTITQVRKMAEVYKRPLGVFFLPEPPRDFDAMRDFRRQEGSGAGEWSPELHGEYRRALAQRDAALELAEIDEVPPSRRWMLGHVADDTEEIAAAARALLLGQAPPPLPKSTGTKYEHLNVWVAALEEAGVLVMTTSGGRVHTSEMRAFSIFYDDFPVIMLNGSDAVRGRLFSLLHEYAHLLLHTGGLCDTLTDTRATDPNSQLESRCNAIAAAILMPPEQIKQAAATLPSSTDQWDYGTLRDAAALFGVSAEAFLRRLTTLGVASRALYEQHRARFVAAYQREEDTGSGAGNWYRNAARNLGKGYVRRIADAYRRRVIDSYTAATFLNVKVDQIDRLAAVAALSESA